MNKVVGTALTTLLVLFPAAAAGGQESKTQDSFTAEGIPYADYTYSYPTTRTGTCLDGMEGVHKTTVEYIAPRPGTLTVETAAFTGDWDLLVLDDQGDVISYNYQSQWIDQPGLEKGSVRLRRSGQKVQIVACNWSSLQTEVEVSYRLGPLNDYRPATARSGFRHLSPGKLADLQEKVPVNIVFAGFGRNQVNERRFLRALPKRSRPVVRAPLYGYGETQYLGLDYEYDYNVTFTDRAYENRLFRFLRKKSERALPTRYQDIYNNQQSNVLEIKNNFHIDAPSVERWLAYNPPKGVDTAEYTVYFLNWYGRKDFRFHVYTKLDEPDPDSGFNAGRQDSQMIAGWGGTPRDDPESGLGKVARVWFYDLSAGPERVAANYIVDRRDLDNDGRQDYRIPPIWEYTTGGYGATQNLTGDLAKLARYVGINFLFTPSPIYSPAITPPRLPERINLDINVYEGAPGVDVSEEWLDLDLVAKNVGDVLPLQKVTADTQDLSVADSTFLSCYTSWWWVYYGPSCYPDKPYSIWANPFVHHGMTLESTRDTEGADYEAGSFNYAMDAMGWAFGYADDNYWDGTQSFVHVFNISSIAKYLGMSSITIHEYGHHFGVSHPHDGFDYEEKLDYGFWNDRFRFTFVGTESNSVMNYLSVNDDFSQFDRDNMLRWHAAAYVTSVNEIAAMILKERNAERSQGLKRADRLIGKAKKALASHRYRAAAALAKDAYGLALRLARSLGIEVTASQSGITIRESGSRGGSASQHHHRGAVDLLSDRPIYDELKGSLPGEAPAPAMARRR